MQNNPYATLPDDKPIRFGEFLGELVAFFGVMASVFGITLLLAV